MRNNRNGFTLIETSVAGIILATALAVGTQMLLAASRQRKACDMCQLALIEAGNVMERLAVEPWSNLEAAEVDTWELGVQAVSGLPNASLDIHIDTIAPEAASGEASARELAAKRITVIVSYGGTSKKRNRETRLVTWRYARIPLNTGAEKNKEQ